MDSPVEHRPNTGTAGRITPRTVPFPVTAPAVTRRRARKGHPLPAPDTDSLPAAFYLPIAENEFDSTAATTSPWDETMQHGGPPAALLARAVERVRPDEDMPIGRISIDMLGPIPQGRIRTEAQILRPGKRIELIEAKLWANERLAVTATAW